MAKIPHKFFWLFLSFAVSGMNLSAQNFMWEPTTPIMAFEWLRGHPWPVQGPEILSIENVSTLRIVPDSANKAGEFPATASFDSEGRMVRYVTQRESGGEILYELVYEPGSRQASKSLDGKPGPLGIQTLDASGKLMQECEKMVLLDEEEKPEAVFNICMGFEYRPDGRLAALEVFGTETDYTGDTLVEKTERMARGTADWNVNFVTWKFESFLKKHGRTPEMKFQYNHRGQVLSAHLEDEEAVSNYSFTYNQSGQLVGGKIDHPWETWPQSFVFEYNDRGLIANSVFTFRDGVRKYRYIYSGR